MKQKNLTEGCPNKCTHFCEDGYKRGYDEAWVGMDRYAIVMLLAGIIIGAGFMFFILK